MSGGLNIGSVAQAAAPPPKTIRYYGYRSSSQADMRTLAFIKRARSLGFPVEEVRDLLDLWRDKSRKSAAVKALAAKHIQALDCKIGELQSMRQALAHLVKRCHVDSRPDCPILGELDGGQSRASVRKGDSP